MKIHLHRSEKGSLTLACFVVVACVVLVGMGGCAAYKLQKKIDQKQKRAATNDVEQFSAQLLSDYKARTGDSTAFSLTIMQVVTQEIGVPISWRLDTSSDLKEWQTLLETHDPGEVDSLVSEAFSTPTNPAQFFRVISTP
jgi:hypothetical protein